MRAWIYSFRSGWLGDKGIVIASNIDDAVRMANAEIDRSRVHTIDTSIWPPLRPLRKDELQELDLNKPVAITLANGNY